MQKTFVDIPEAMSISGDRILVRRCFEEFHKAGGRSKAQRVAETNLKTNSPAGIMNRKIKARMKRIIFNWTEAIKCSKSNDQGYKLYTPTFVTLTLPSMQRHSDKEINRNALIPFIATLKRKYFVEHYVWRAEKQKNGNIHYHVIIDKFVGWQNIRREWNTQMDGLGYIEEYRRNQKKFHSEGYKCNEQDLLHRSQEKQKKAYEDGIKNNWSNPNSTDIHALKEIQNVAKYCTKYLTKSPEEEELKLLDIQLSKNIIAVEEYDRRKKDLDKKIDKSKINARLWGCSDDLRTVIDYKTIIDQNTNNFIEEAIQMPTNKIIKDEHYTIIYCKDIHAILANHRAVATDLQAHFQDTYYKLYPTQKPPNKSIKNMVERWEPLHIQIEDGQMIFEGF